MTVHLISKPLEPVALETLKAALSLHQNDAVVILLSPGIPPPSLPGIQLYRLNGSSAGVSGSHEVEIAYREVVELLFRADKAITW